MEDGCILDEISEVVEIISEDVEKYSLDEYIEDELSISLEELSTSKVLDE